MKFLPYDRPFTELEAMISLQADYDRAAEVTVQGYASLWSWSRGKVARFLEKIGVEIRYSENTSKKQNQRGQIMIQISDRSNVENEQIRLIDSKGLSRVTDRPKRKNGQITDRSQSTTIDPNTKPKTLSSNFDQFWQFYPKKQGKKDAQKAWHKISPDEELTRTILTALETQKGSDQWKKNGGQYIPLPATWVNGRRWEDEMSVRVKPADDEGVYRSYQCI